MYTWHFTVGRGRPLTGDLVRVVDGAAVYIRAFSVSAKRRDGDDKTSSTQRQRTATAVKEIRSLPARQGVDARSLAAQPPPSFAIRRELVNSRPRPPSAAPGRFGRPSRPARVGTYDDDDDDDDDERPARRYGGGGGRSRMPRGRGGRDGRGARGVTEFGSETFSDEGDLEQKISKLREKVNPREEGLSPQEIEMEDELSDEEQDYEDMAAGGFTLDYEPETNRELLERWRPANLASPTGIIESVRYKLAVATDNQHTQYRPSGDHMMRVKRGLGTMFEDPKQRALMQDWKDDHELANAMKWMQDFYQEDFGELSKEQKNEIMKQWVAGHYDEPKMPSEEVTDAMSMVRSYMKRNDSFMSSDRQKMEAQLQSLLPAQSLGKGKAPIEKKKKQPRARA